jgi:sugar lactone lactonase YvrE
MAVSPNGSTLFVSGKSDLGRSAGPGYKTAAYRAATGKQLWASRYRGPTKGGDTPDAMAVSPDGSTVFVTGNSPGRNTGNDYATVAYSAATGKQLWASRYNGPANGYDAAKAIAVSPDGTAVYVTGRSFAGANNFSYATIAYNATTGKQLWVSRYGQGTGAAGAESVAVSPDGGRVYVTGQSFPGSSDSVYATLAYSAASGKQLWARPYHGRGVKFNDANAMAVNPKGTTVFVTGTSGFEIATVAYNAATGQLRWASRFHGAQEADDANVSLAVSPAGRTVFVAGTAHGEFTTIAYGAATGKQRWASQHGGYVVHSVAVSPRANAVYVTGYGRSDTGFFTVAWTAATGRHLWTSLGPVGGIGFGSAELIAASPNGRTVFVTGWTQVGSHDDYLTIAYRS